MANSFLLSPQEIEEIAKEGLRICRNHEAVEREQQKRCDMRDYPFGYNNEDLQKEMGDFFMIGKRCNEQVKTLFTRIKAQISNKSVLLHHRDYNAIEKLLKEHLDNDDTSIMQLLKKRIELSESLEKQFNGIREDMMNQARVAREYGLWQAKEGVKSDPEKYGIHKNPKTENEGNSSKTFLASGKRKISENEKYKYRRLSETFENDCELVSRHVRQVMRSGTDDWKIDDIMDKFNSKDDYANLIDINDEFEELFVVLPLKHTFNREVIFESNALDPLFSKLSNQFNHSLKLESNLPDSEMKDNATYDDKWNELRQEWIHESISFVYTHWDWVFSRVWNPSLTRRYNAVFDGLDQYFVPKLKETVKNAEYEKENLLKAMKEMKRVLSLNEIRDIVNCMESSCFGGGVVNRNGYISDPRYPLSRLFGDGSGYKQLRDSCDYQAHFESFGGLRFLQPDIISTTLGLYQDILLAMRRVSWAYVNYSVFLPNNQEKRETPFAIACAIDYLNEQVTYLKMMQQRRQRGKKWKATKRKAAKAAKAGEAGKGGKGIKAGNMVKRLEASSEAIEEKKRDETNEEMVNDMKHEMEDKLEGELEGELEDEMEDEMENEEQKDDLTDMKDRTGEWMPVLPNQDTFSKVKSQYIDYDKSVSYFTMLHSLRQSMENEKFKEFYTVKNLNSIYNGDINYSFHKNCSWYTSKLNSNLFEIKGKKRRVENYGKNDTKIKSIVGQILSGIESGKFENCEKLLSFDVWQDGNDNENLNVILFYKHSDSLRPLNGYLKEVDEFKTMKIKQLILEYFEEDSMQDLTKDVIGDYFEKIYGYNESSSLQDQLIKAKLELIEKEYEKSLLQLIGNKYEMIINLEKFGIVHRMVENENIAVKSLSENKDLILHNFDFASIVRMDVYGNEYRTNVESKSKYLTTTLFAATPSEISEKYGGDLIVESKRDVMRTLLSDIIKLEKSKPGLTVNEEYEELRRKVTGKMMKYLTMSSKSGNEDSKDDNKKEVESDNNGQISQETGRKKKRNKRMRKKDEEFQSINFIQKWDDNGSCMMYGNERNCVMLALDAIDDLSGFDTEFVNSVQFQSLENDQLNTPFKWAHHCCNLKSAIEQSMEKIKSNVKLFGTYDGLKTQLETSVDMALSQAERPSNVENLTVIKDTMRQVQSKIDQLKLQITQ